MAILNSFFSYMGGKYSSARYYPHPLHKTIVEPFAGAAGYSTHYPSRQVLLYDVDPHIYGIWKYLIKVKPEEILQLPTVFDDVRECKIPQEAKWLIGHWVNKGNSSPCFKMSAWGRSGLRPGSFWGVALKQRLARQVEYIRHWKIYNQDYESVEVKQATWFIDPPYQGINACYNYNQINYKQLSKWCKSRQGQVIVCEGPKADWLPFVKFRDTKSTNHKSRNTHSQEFIYYRQKQ